MKPPMATPIIPVVASTTLELSQDELFELDELDEQEFDDILLRRQFNFFTKQSNRNKLTQKYGCT